MTCTPSHLRNAVGGNAVPQGGGSKAAEAMFAAAFPAKPDCGGCSHPAHGSKCWAYVADGMCDCDDYEPMQPALETARDRGLAPSRYAVDGVGYPCGCEFRTVDMTSGSGHDSTALRWRPCAIHIAGYERYSWEDWEGQKADILARMAGLVRYELEAIARKADLDAEQGVTGRSLYDDALEDWRALGDALEAVMGG